MTLLPQRSKGGGGNVFLGIQSSRICVLYSFWPNFYNTTCVTFVVLNILKSSAYRAGTPDVTKANPV